MTDWTKYLEGAYRRTLDKESELLAFVDEIAKAVDLHGDNVTFARVLENVKGLREAYGGMCDRLQSAVQRHELGLGGEHVDTLVIEELDRLRGNKVIRVVTEDRREDVARLDWLENNWPVQIDTPTDEDSRDALEIDVIRGSHNDREWSTVSGGQSVRAAIDAARDKSTQSSGLPHNSKENK